MSAAERVETTRAEETEQLAAQLAAALGPGDVVLLSGELGSGKTTFVRGACRALGVHGPVTSPTFTLARRYEDGSVPISHLDLYRLAGVADGDPALLDEELAPDRIAFVEWPEADEAQLTGARVAARVRLEHLGGDRRAVTVERAA
ncbi:MAG TPA: tRNA (adenosine(37)-N6)-threonylcarbamoyltransferase complex ATPase subunit type 1 TsaE [Solirubrobacteraceae bacterium]